MCEFGAWHEKSLRASKRPVMTIALHAPQVSCRKTSSPASLPSRCMLPGSVLYLWLTNLLSYTMLCSYSYVRSCHEGAKKVNMRGFGAHAYRLGTFAKPTRCNIHSFLPMNVFHSVTIGNKAT